MTHNDPADCFLCRRHAWSIGVKCMGRERWVCRECMAVAKEIGEMKKAGFDRYEAIACTDAGNIAGRSLGEKTDLAELTVEEYHDFIRTVITAFGDAIRKQVEGGAAPF